MITTTPPTSPPTKLGAWTMPEPVPGLPTTCFIKIYECMVTDWDDINGFLLIVGHAGPLRAIAAFRARLRVDTDMGDADAFLRGPARFGHRPGPTTSDDVTHLVDNVVHLWAIRAPHCGNYPRCGMQGTPPADVVCQDYLGAGWPDHNWADPPNHELRYCNRCGSYETVPGHPELMTRCPRCFQIDDADGLYLHLDATPETPGAFPVTCWRS